MNKKSSSKAYSISGAHMVMAKSAHVFSESDDDLREYIPSTKGCCGMKNRLMCCLHAIFFFFGLVFFVTGFCSPYWIWLEEEGSALNAWNSRDEINGLWLNCTKFTYPDDSDSGWKCESLDIKHSGDWHKSITLLMILIFLAIVIAMFTLVLMPITAVFQLIAGVLSVVVLVIYSQNSDYTDDLHWSFYMAICSAVVFVLNGGIQCLVQYQRGCVARPTWPCECCRGKHGKGCQEKPSVCSGFGCCGPVEVNTPM